MTARRANQLKDLRPSLDLCGREQPRSRARKNQFPQAIQPDLGRPVLYRKKFGLICEPKIVSSRSFRSRSEGRTRRHERWDAECDGRGGVVDERRQYGRQSRVVLTPLGWCQLCR